MTEFKRGRIESWTQHSPDGNGTFRISRTDHLTGPIRGMFGVTNLEAFTDSSNINFLPATDENPAKVVTVVTALGTESAARQAAESTYARMGVSKRLSRLQLREQQPQPSDETLSTGEIEVTYAKGEKPVESSFTIFLPPSADRNSQISTISGNVHTQGTTGDLSVFTGSGNVHTDGHRGDQTVETKRGPIDIKNASEGRLNLRSERGDVVVQETDASTSPLFVNTGLGQVLIKGADIEKGYVKTEIGPIEVNVKNADLHVNAETQGQIFSPTHYSFITTARETVLQNGEPVNVVRGHFGESPKTDNTLDLQSKKGFIQFRRDTSVVDTDKFPPYPPTNTP